MYVYPESKRHGRETEQNDEEHGCGASSLGFCVALLSLLLERTGPQCCFQSPTAFRQVTILLASSQPTTEQQGDKMGVIALSICAH